MTMRSLAMLLAGSAAVFTGISSVHAQVAGRVGGVDVYANGAPFGAAPYTAGRKTTHVQKLADGTTITQVTLGKEARDSAGRTYSESHLEATANGDESPVITNGRISDPVARIHIEWNSSSRIATVFHTPDAIRPAPAPTSQIRPTVSNHPRQEVENLGTKTINGLLVEGIRTTRVIPAGQQGNDQPITVTHEAWRSTELNLTVLSIQDDPRRGVTTMELTDIVPGEPDPWLFQVPEGYTVREHVPDQPN
jgi:hypothetical protein